jgi:hypothetical protein
VNFCTSYRWLKTGLGGKQGFPAAQALEADLELALGGQRDGAGSAAFETDLTTGKALQRLGHHRQSRGGIPLKYIIRAEIEAFEVGAAGGGVDGRDPRKFSAQIVQQALSAFVQLSHE